MKSTVLGIDTSGTSCSVALVRGSRHETWLYVRRATVGNAHSKVVLAMVRDVLAEASLALAGCDAIAYAAGPGSFTGLRIACAVAQGLAFGAHRPIVPVGTLEAIAHSAAQSPGEPVGQILVAMDARMGELYWALFDCASGVSIVMPPALASPEALRARLSARIGRMVPLGCGNAWSVHGDAMNGLVERVIDRHAADAVDVAQLGRTGYEEGRAIEPEDASPLYVRYDVALTTAERDARGRIDAVESKRSRALPAKSSRAA